MPGIGTFVGGFIGGMIGDYVGSEVGAKIDDEIVESERRKTIKERPKRLNLRNNLYARYFASQSLTFCMLHKINFGYTCAPLTVVTKYYIVELYHFSVDLC